VPRRSSSAAASQLPLIAGDPPRDAAASSRHGRTTASWTTFPCSRCGEATRALSDTDRQIRELCRACFGKGEDRRPHELNELTGKEWAQKSRSVEQYPDTRSPKQRLHGASFPQSLAREQIEIYTAVGETVLDPFVGVGTTLDACLEVGRRGVGIDVNEEFIDLARADLAAGAADDQVQLIVGDARSLSSSIAAESVDFVLTSPPYGSLLRQVKGSFAYKWQEHSTIRPILNPVPYSGHPLDIGNLDYDQFLDAIKEVLVETYKVQRPGSYAVWVVKDFRALKADVPYVNYHGHFIAQAEAAGYVLWDLRIWDQTTFRPLVCLGYPSKNFYLNIGHSYLVVLRKR
jgi:DNA modification methylase